MHAKLREFFPGRYSLTRQVTRSKFLGDKSQFFYSFMFFIQGMRDVTKTHLHRPVTSGVMSDAQRLLEETSS